jgi:hypothetical protein
LDAFADRYRPFLLWFRAVEAYEASAFFIAARLFFEFGSDDQ